MTRPAPSLLAWLAIAWSGLFLAPWYGVEGGLPAWLAAPGKGTPAIAQIFSGGRLWLALLIPLLLLVTWAAWTKRARLLTWGAAFLLVWLVIQGMAINHRGWSYAWLGALLGDAPTQPAMGWGAAGLALAALMLFSYGRAWRGACNSDVFVTGALTLMIGLMVLFVAYPTASVLLSAVRDNHGGFAPAEFFEKFFNAGIWGLGCITGGTGCGVAWNTFFLAVLVGLATTLLGLAFALVALRTRLKLKPLIRALSILPIITPPFVIALALIILFGRAGIVTTWLAQVMDIPRSRWIYGLPGIAIAQTLAFTPIAFLVLVGVLQGVSPTLEEAAQTLRAKPWHAFRTITWPLIRPGLANAFLIGFIESMADFANPLVIGGNFSVLSTDIFFAVVGAAHDQGRAAVLAIVLLGFTLMAFVAQNAWLGRRHYTSVAGKGDAGLPAPLPARLRIACLAAVLPWLAFTVVIYGIILVGGFVESLGRDNTPTWRWFTTAFSIERGIGGWFLSGSAWSSFITTMEIALASMPITAALGILTAWLLNRQHFPGRRSFEFLTMTSFAIPGTVIGVSYILAFNVPPVELTGTGLILCIAFVFRNMPVGIRAGLANLSQIDRSLDEASLTLGERSFGTLRKVLLPILRPAIITAMSYSFVRAVTAVSAVIFLVTGEYNLATVYIVGRADVGEYGLAIVYAAMLIVVMMVVLVGVQMLVGERRLGRRTMPLGATDLVVAQS